MTHVITNYSLLMQNRTRCVNGATVQERSDLLLKNSPFIGVQG